MPRTFICSTGTSAAKLLLDDAGRRLARGKLREWVHAQGCENVQDTANNPPRRVGKQCAPSLRGGITPDIQHKVTQAAATIFVTFQDFEPVGEALTQRLSAEIHSLVRMRLEAKDRVLLLRSDSPDSPEGLACAKAVAGYLERYWTGVNVVTESVPCLQVDDADQLRRVGVGEFLSRAARMDCWENLKQLDDCDPFRFLARMSSPQALAEKTHINVGNGLCWLKPGNTTDRYLVSAESWRLLVWRAIREDKVGADYPQQIDIDPLRDRNRYAPLTWLENIP